MDNTRRETFSDLGLHRPSTSAILDYSRRESFCDVGRQKICNSLGNGRRKGLNNNISQLSGPSIDSESNPHRDDIDDLDYFLRVYDSLDLDCVGRGSLTEISRFYTDRINCEYLRRDSLDGVQRDHSSIYDSFRTDSINALMGKHSYDIIGIKNISDRPIQSVSFL